MRRHLDEAIWEAVMRMTLASTAICLCVSGPAVAAPVESNTSDRGRTEALQDRGADTWRERRHFLYDDEYTPKTDGAGRAQDACAKEWVRVRTNDGKTVVRRVNRCD
jgi:hypothetical protein